MEKPDTGQNQERNKRHDHVLFSHKKMETQKQRKSPTFPFFPLWPSTTNHQTHILDTSQLFWKPTLLTTNSFPTPHQDIPCRPTPRRSTTQSHTKPSARLQPSFATTAMTGMNFARTRHCSSPQEGYHDDKNAEKANETKNCRN
jgi:hypothetical protein